VCPVFQGNVLQIIEINLFVGKGFCNLGFIICLRRIKFCLTIIWVCTAYVYLPPKGF